MGSNSPFHGSTRADVCVPRNEALALPSLLQESNSKTNAFEAEFVARLALYLAQQGTRKGQITVLTAYVGQLLELRQVLYVSSLPPCNPIEPNHCRRVKVCRPCKPGGHLRLNTTLCLGLLDKGLPVPESTQKQQHILPAWLDCYAVRKVCPCLLVRKLEWGGLQQPWMTELPEPMLSRR